MSAAGTSDAELDGDGLPDRTRAWVQAALGPSAQLLSAARLVGGWSSEMRQLQVAYPAGLRSFVLRSFTKPFYVRHAEGLLDREAAVLAQLADGPIPVASVVAVDARGAACAFPSLLRTHLPGSIRLQDDAGAPARIERLAELLVQIHRVPVTDATRPRSYQAWTRHDVVRVPERTQRAAAWARAIDVIRQPAPDYAGCFLHRDFHPGNVLFEAHATSPAISGIVDWVETSWGPAELDVAHCSTALMLLHGPQVGLQFAERYAAAGGTLTERRAARLYWYLLDALAYAPDAEKLVVAWREAGRSDLTPELVQARLEQYVDELLLRWG